MTTFTKTSVQTGGTDVEYMYVSHTDHLVLFYSADLGAWAVGKYQLSRVVSKPSFWFPTWPDTNQAVQLQKMARGLKFWM